MGRKNTRKNNISGNSHNQQDTLEENNKKIDDFKTIIDEINKLPQTRFFKKLSKLPKTKSENCKK